jgi:hypothetical protein
MRKSGILVASTIFMAAVAAAEPRSRSFVIELSDGTRVTALDEPVRRGTVVTFHSASGGALTGVPAEMIVRIVQDGDNGQSAAAASKARPRAMVGSRPSARAAQPDAPGLEPGEVLVLGPMGDGVAPSMGGAFAGAANASAAGAGGGAPGYGGALNSNVNPNVANPDVGVNPINPNQTVIGTDGLPRVASSTDLSRAQAAQTAVGPNGFPVTATGAPTVIGPNGTPTLAPGVPGSGTPVIGPNGTPVTAAGTSPTTAQPVIGPNGTPVLAPRGQPGSVQPGQAGSAQPLIGPNGTPVLAPQGQPGSAQPGQPGSAQPVIGPNGTPVLAPQGQPGGPATGASPSGAPSGGAAPSGAASGGASPGGGS